MAAGVSHGKIIGSVGKYPILQIGHSLGYLRPLGEQKCWEGVPAHYTPLADFKNIQVLDVFENAVMVKTKDVAQELLLLAEGRDGTPMTLSYDTGRAFHGKADGCWIFSDTACVLASKIDDLTHEQVVNPADTQFEASTLLISEDRIAYLVDGEHSRRLVVKKPLDKWERFFIDLDIRYDLANFHMDGEKVFCFLSENSKSYCMELRERGDFTVEQLPDDFFIERITFFRRDLVVTIGKDQKMRVFCKTPSGYSLSFCDEKNSLFACMDFKENPGFLWSLARGEHGQSVVSRYPVELSEKGLGIGNGYSYIFPLESTASFTKMEVLGDKVLLSGGREAEPCIVQCGQIGLEVKSLFKKGTEPIKWEAYSVSPGAAHYVVQTKNRHYFFVSKKV